MTGDFLFGLVAGIAGTAVFIIGFIVVSKARAYRDEWREHESTYDKRVWGRDE